MAKFLPYYMLGCFFIFRLFCQFPLKISTKRVETSFVYYIYTVVFALIFIVVFVFAFLWEDRSQMGIIYASNPLWGYASLTNMVIPLFLVPLVSTKLWNEFYQLLLVIDSILESHGADIPYRKQKITLVCFFAIFGFIFGVIKFYDLMEPAWVEMHVMNHLSHGYSLLTNILAVHIVFATSFLRCRFQCLNHQLSTLFKNSKISSENLTKNIQTYQRMHLQLCQLSLRISSHFNYAVLLTLANTCGAVLTSLYASFTQGRLNSVVGLLSAGKWHFHELVIFIGLLLPFDLLKSEANKTGSVLHEAFLDARDCSNQTQVNTFSLQLIHNKLVFSTGLFNASMKIALPVASAIGTYLVIFVQFSNTSKEENPN